MRRYRTYIVAAIALAILATMPQLVSSYYVRLLSIILIYAIFAMSLDIILGYGGLPSLGHAASFGAAAYMVALLNVKVLPSGGFGMELAAGILFAALVAALFGPLALRTRGIYFLMVTLSLSMVLWAIAFKWRSLTGGDDGIPRIAPPQFSFIPWNFALPINYYYFVLFFFVIAVVLMLLIVDSPFGHVLVGIHENETRMASMGYNVWIYKYMALIIAGTFAGLAGILVAYYNTFVSPSVLHISTSAEGLIMVILGGQRTLLGPAIGAGIIVLVKHLLSTYTDRWPMILGIIFMLVVILAPQGIYRVIKRYLLGTRS
jgi:branched-chain amino acid transport system permease protein